MALTLPLAYLEWLTRRPEIGALIALALLLLLGFRDVFRFSPTRTWAIASVCFRQSIRRRVLWITPLVILGIITVSQFQRPVDPQDEIRQTIRYCLFATGILLTLVLIILACTNIPREIESRVIYTVATKPTTRLEIVLGKVIGFACVSFWILLIMGLFTLGYLHFRDWRLRQNIAAVLPRLSPDDQARPALEYYRDRGTLHARRVFQPLNLSLLSHKPANPGDFWVPPTEGELLVQFVIDRSIIPANTPLELAVNVAARKVPSPSTRPAATQPATQEAPVVPRAILDLRNRFKEVVIDGRQLVFNGGNELPDGVGQLQTTIESSILDRWVPPGSPPTEVFVGIVGLTPGFVYSTPGLVAQSNPSSGINPVSDFLLLVPPDPAANRAPLAFRPMGILFGAQRGFYGQQLRGSRGESGRIALFRFRNLRLEPQSGYTFEFRAGIEADYADEDSDAARPAPRDTEAQVQMVSFEFYKGAGLSFTRRPDATLLIPIENNRTTYFDVPAAAVEGGDFSVAVRLLNPGFLGLRSDSEWSLKMAAADQPFAWNLLKSLSILWLLSLLLIIVAVFCSTFLSWPIAVVLTLLILTGRWGVQQLGDLASPGVGRQIVQEMFRGTDAAQSRAVSESVDLMVRSLNEVATILPDLSRYPAIEEIQRGIAIAPATLLDSLRVTAGWGGILLVLSYIFLKYKEVAP